MKGPVLLIILVIPPPIPLCSVSRSACVSVGAAADAPGRPRVPVCTGHEHPAEAQRYRRPHEG